MIIGEIFRACGRFGLLVSTFLHMVIREPTFYEFRSIRASGSTEPSGRTRASSRPHLRRKNSHDGDGWRQGRRGSA
jgi:hypothetical protein